MSPATKYLLIEHADGNNPARVVICDSPEQRNVETLRAIFGTSDVPESNKEEAAASLRVLRDTKELHFEGDPPLCWIDGFIESTAERLATRLHDNSPEGLCAQWRALMVDLDKQRDRGDQFEQAQLEAKIAAMEARLHDKNIDPQNYR